jgi:hypothetical protein
MEDELDFGGFKALLEKASRIEDNIDWSVHTVDYDQFKKRLRSFAQRRVRIRSMLLASVDGSISEQELLEMLGPRTPFPSRRSSVADDRFETPIGQEMETDYVPLEEPGVESGSSDFESIDSLTNSFTKRRAKKRSTTRRLSSAERNELTLFLSCEMDKALMFYLAQWQGLSRRLELQQHSAALGRPSLDPDIGDEILELFAFCVINVVTTHQILIRYDAFARAFEGTPLRNYYMKQVKKHPSAFRKIFFHEELNAVADSYTTGNETSPIIVSFCAQRFMFQDIMSSLDSHQGTPLQIKDVRCTTSSLYSMWKLALSGLFLDRLGLEPAYLTELGKGLSKQMEQLARWREKKHEILGPRTEKKLTGMQSYHLTLNLLSAFLYCMNYYIVEPSSTMYVNRLGVHDTMSGTLIGMMPLAALFSSIPYSMWTNKSFRHPLIMSSFLMAAGNIIYSTADIFSSFPMALAGRFISGLGAPKCIVRRYMADTTPLSLRTSVNAGFGMVVAAGSAMGPAMAVVLNSYELTIEIPNFAFVTLNGLTLPGYFMAALWFTFTIIVLATFEEPDREGLEEQKERDQSRSIPGSPTMQSGAVPDPPQGLSYNPLPDVELKTIFSGESHDYSSELTVRQPHSSRIVQWMYDVRNFMDLITLPVRLCLGLLFCKVFTIEALVSATSALTKNRYKWKVQQVGTLGFTNGLLVIPFSVLVGRLSLSRQDRTLMRWLVCTGCLGLFLLIDISDLVATPTGDYNEGNLLAVSPQRYIVGYFLAYISIQAFEGVIGSTLSKVIPTSLASGTFNSGLLATLVDTSGRACGDIFISMVGFINLRQLMNLVSVCLSYLFTVKLSNSSFSSSLLSCNSCSFLDFALCFLV